MEFSPRSEKNNFADYYSGFERNFIKDTDNGYGYHLSDNDFYVFLTAHEYKHFSQSGTGIRSLLDCYIFLKAKGELLDWDYIREQTDIMGITGFEQRRRDIAFKIFSDPDRRELDGAEQEMLDRYLDNGTYGSLENNVRNELEYQSKKQFYINRIFLSKEKMAQSVPFTKKSVLLYPAGFVVRAFRILLFKKRRMIRIVKAVNKYGK